MENTSYGYCPPGYRAWGFRGRPQTCLSHVPVNVEELERAFEVHVFAPALVKENFSVVTKNDILYVGYRATEEGLKGKFTRKEYQRKGFQRSFRLNGKIDVERITVSYADGVLKIVLPKLNG